MKKKKKVNLSFLLLKEKKIRREFYLIARYKQKVGNKSKIDFYLLKKKKKKKKREANKQTRKDFFLSK